MKRSVFALLALVILSPGCLAADVYVCKGAHGETVFQDHPCATQQAAVSHMSTPAAGALSNTGGQSRDTIVRQFVENHPDLAYGQNIALVKAAMKALNDGHTDIVSLLDAAYWRAKALPTWTSRSTPVTRSTHAPAPSRRAPTQAVRGLGVSAYASGHIHAYRCTKPDGRTYYSRGACGTTTTVVGEKVRNWQNDTVVGAPGAVMIGPNEAIDPRTGRAVQLTAAPTSVPVYQRTQDQAAPANVNATCLAVRKALQKQPFSRKLKKREYQLCQKGRSLYDTAPRPSNVYAPGGH